MGLKDWCLGDTLDNFNVFSYEQNKDPLKGFERKTCSDLTGFNRIILDFTLRPN